MKEWIRITDRMQGQTLFEGEGEVERLATGGVRLQFEGELESGRWLLAQNGCVLDNSAEIHSKAIIRPEQSSRVEVETPFGKLEMPLEKIRYEKDETQALISWVLEGQEFCFLAEYRPL